MVANLSRTVEAFIPGSLDAVISVYPNPSEAVFMIGADREVNVLVQDLQGRTVLRQDKASAVDLTNYASGVYMLRITDAAGSLLRVERIVKDQH
jgi:hypothetical protein